MNATHVHHWKIGQPSRGMSHGICACGAERDWRDPEWNPQTYRSTQPAEVCPHCNRKLRANSGAGVHIRTCKARPQ